MAFSGGGNKPFSPFTMNAGQTAQGQPPQATASFTFGGGMGGAGSGFSFGGGAPAPGAVSTSTSTPQLSFTAPTPAATSAPLFNFGNPAANVEVSGSGTALNFGFAGGPGPNPPQVTPASSAGSLAGSVGVTPSQSLLSFGAPAAAAQTPTAAATVSAPSLSAAAAPPLSAAAAPISFTSVPPSTAAAGSIQRAFAAPTTQVAAAPSLTLGTPSTAAPTAPSGFSFGAGAGTGVTPSAGSLNLTKSAATAAPATTQGAGAPTAPATTTATTQSNTANVSQINFRQLQEAINKWMMDLQEQEKFFLEHATRVNAWDRTLISNGDKIAKLNESISKVKSDHARLEHALEYIRTQQQEFETFLEPLEAGLPVNIPVEPEREQLYTLTDGVDTQLQQMAEDLKEVIRHINEANKTVDKHDPISQILRILNEHMDALHWVEDNTNQVKRSLEDVSKQHQTAKKDHERSLRMMFK